MNRRLSILSLLIVCNLLLGWVGLRAMSDTVQSEASPVYAIEYLAPGSEVLSEAAKQALTDALQGWSERRPYNDVFYLVNLEWHGNWAIGSLTSANLAARNTTRPAIDLHEIEDTEITLYNMIAFVLVQTADGWDAAIDSDPKAQDLLLSIPNDGLSAEAKAAIFPANQRVRTPPISTQQQYNNYRFPFHKETNPYCRTRSGLGWHGSVSWDGLPINHALDFARCSGGGFKILAPAPGVVDNVCQTGDEQAGVIIKTTGTDDERIGLLHIQRSTLAVSHGQTVTQGQYLGMAVEGNLVGGCGTSNGTHIHVVFPFKPFTIDGITVSDTSTPDNGVPLYSTNPPTCSGAGEMGSLLWDQQQACNMTAEQSWRVYFSQEREFYFDIQRTSGNLEFDANLKADGGAWVATSSSTNGALQFAHRTGAGNFFFHLTPRAGTSGEYTIVIKQGRPAPTSTASWDFVSLNGSSNWLAGGNRLDHHSFVTDGWRLNISTGIDPMLFSAPLSIHAASYRYLAVTMNLAMNRACNSTAVFFNTDTSLDFAQSRVVSTAISQNVMQTVYFDMGNHAAWTGTIGRLRLDLDDCGTAGNGNVVIKSIVLTNTPGNQALTVNNPGFEDAGTSDALPASWSVKNATKDKRACNKPDKDKLVAHEGACAFQFTGDASTAAKVQQDISTSNAVSGDKLLVSQWVNTKNLSTGGRIQLVVKYTNGGKDKLKLDITAGTTSDYTEYSGELTLTGPVATVKYIAMMKIGSGKYYLDDVTLALQKASPASTDDLIPMPASLSTRQ